MRKRKRKARPAPVRPLELVPARVAKRRPPYAIVAGRIRATVDKLAEFPNIGRGGRVPGTRELVVSRTPYVVAYVVDADDVTILAILHGAQRWPEAL